MSKRELRAKAHRYRLRAQELVEICPPTLCGIAYHKLLQRVAALEIAARKCEIQAQGV